MMYTNKRQILVNNQMLLCYETAGHCPSIRAQKCFHFLKKPTKHQYVRNSEFVIGLRLVVVKFFCFVTCLFWETRSAQIKRNYENAFLQFCSEAIAFSHTRGVEVYLGLCTPRECQHGGQNGQDIRTYYARVGQSPSGRSLLW